MPLDALLSHHHDLFFAVVFNNNNSSTKDSVVNIDFQIMLRLLSQCNKQLAAAMQPRLARIRTQLDLCLALKSELYYAYLARQIPRLHVMHDSKWYIRGFVLPNDTDLDYNNGDVEVCVDYHRVKACARHLFIVTVDATHMRHNPDHNNNMTLQVQPYTATTGIFKRNAAPWLGYRNGICAHLFSSSHA